MSVEKSPQLLTLKQVIEMTGLKRSSIYFYMSLNKFPKNKKMTTRRVGWLREDIEKWIMSLKS